jgi:hypothetical protein
VVRENDVVGPEKYLSDAACVHDVDEREVQLGHQALMNGSRRRRHDVLPIDEFVPLPVVLEAREAEEVVVGELRRRGRTRLVVTRHARHPSIVLPICGSASSAKSVPRDPLERGPARPQAW